jgi:Ca-activated chloride channel family protein
VKPWAILLTIGVASTTALSAQRTFRARVDLIHFSVVVTDKQGKHVAGLTVEDFEILEGDTPQAIKFFSAGDAGEELPLHVGLLLDTSGSMDLDIKDARTAVIKFLNAMERAADVTLVDFDTEVRVARYGANDFPRLIERIRNRKPGGWTALYDALATYLNGAAEQTGQKVLIMYTDGGDTRSSFSLSQLIDMLRASDVTVYALGYLENQSSSARHDQRMQLQRLSGMTGGQAFFPSSVKELESIYDQIQKELSARYSLGYTSADTRTDGKWREVKVRLKRPDLKGAKIRTRDGYFAPLRGSSQTRH